MDNSENMNNSEKLLFYALAKRATTGVISQIVGGRIVDYFVGKLNGKIVSDENDEYKFYTKDYALKCARDFRARCKRDAITQGLLKA